MGFISHPMFTIHDYNVSIPVLMIYNMLDVSNKSQQYVKACSTVEIASYTNGPDDCVHMKALSKVLTL